MEAHILYHYRIVYQSYISHVNIHLTCPFQDVADYTEEKSSVI